MQKPQRLQRQIDDRRHAQMSREEADSAVSLGRNRLAIFRRRLLLGAEGTCDRLRFFAAWELNDAALVAGDNDV